MTTLREAAQQALAAMEAADVDPHSSDAVYKAIVALKAALADPVQEPVTNNPDPYHLSRILHELAGSASMCWEHVERAGVFESTQAAEFVAAAIAEIRQRIKAAPPQRKPLTEEEIAALLSQSAGVDIKINGGDLLFARAIERAHGIGEAK